MEAPRQSQECSMHWYLLYTKPRQERCALENLERQGYECFMPLFASEKLQHGVVTVRNEPLFPRYLFIRLDQGAGAKSWGPIRSTKGVSHLVRFGTDFPRIDDGMVNYLRLKGLDEAGQATPLFLTGERIRLSEGALANVEGVYQMADGDQRVLVLIEMLSKPMTLSVPTRILRKVS